MSAISNLNCAINHLAAGLCSDPPGELKRSTDSIAGFGEKLPGHGRKGQIEARGGGRRGKRRR